MNKSVAHIVTAFMATEQFCFPMNKKNSSALVNITKGHKLPCFSSSEILRRVYSIK